MKRIQKWSPLCLPVLLIVGLATGWMVTQQAGVAPSEAQVAGGPQKAPGPQAKLLPPKLPASPAPPPEEKIEAPPAPTSRQRPTMQSLLEKIRNMPGGPEMIEEARRRGARIGMRSDKPEFPLSCLNPFKVKKAEAQSTLSLTLDPSNNWYSSSPWGSASFRGVIFSEFHSVTTGVNLYVISSAVGTRIIQPSVSFTFDAPADGWYIVNIEAFGAQASMKHYEAGTYTTVGNWNYSNYSGIPKSYPVLVELAAGRHYFYWVVSSPVITYVYGANAFSI